MVARIGTLILLLKFIALLLLFVVSSILIVLLYILIFTPWHPPDFGLNIFWSLFGWHRI